MRCDDKQPTYNSYCPDHPDPAGRLICMSLQTTGNTRRWFFYRPPLGAAQRRRNKMGLFGISHGKDQGKPSMPCLPENSSFDRWHTTPNPGATREESPGKTPAGPEPGPAKERGPHPHW